MPFSRLILLVCCSTSVYAQTGNAPFLMQDPSAGAYNRHLQHPFSVVLNPASLARHSQMQLSVAAEKKYALAAYTQYVLNYCGPLAGGAVNLNIQYLNLSKFSEFQSSCTYARSLGSQAEAGITFYYYQRRIPGYLQSGLPAGQVGVRVFLRPDLVVGWSVFNPSGKKRIANSGLSLPAVYRMGMGYMVSELVSFAFEISKEQDRPISLSAAFYYQPATELSVHAGMLSAGKQLFLRTVFQSVAWRSAIQLSVHPQLGITPSLSCSYLIAKKK